MQLNIPAEQALGLAELLTTTINDEIGESGARVHALITTGDGGLAAAPLIVAFTIGDTNFATFEVNVAGTADEVP